MEFILKEADPLIKILLSKRNKSEECEVVEKNRGIILEVQRNQLPEQIES